MMRAEKMIYFFDDYENFYAEKFLDFLPENRRKKYEKLKLKKDKDNCVISYLLLKKALKNFGIESFEILTGENGKPFLKNNVNVFFNISHTNTGVAVAVSENPVGIDVQEILPVKNGVVERCFSEKEREMIFNSSHPEKEFTRLWTLKESAVKCSSQTIADLKKFCFESSEKTFKKYEKFFTTFERKNLFISVCGEREFIKISETKTEELL